MAGPADPTLTAYFLSVYRPQRLSLGDRAAAEIHRACRQFSEWFGADVPLSDLSDDCLSAFLGYLNRRVSPSTVNNRRAQILAVWRFAAKRHLCCGPEDVPRAREPERIPEAWTLAQVEQLVGFCRFVPGWVGVTPAGAWWSALTLACYWTAARISTVLAFRTADVDLAQRWIVSRQQKNGRHRLYHLSDQAAAAIGAIWCPHRERLFEWPHCPRYLWTCFRRIVKAAGLPCSLDGRGLFHRLRRTSLSYAAAVSLDAARDLAGHSTSQVTRRHYVDPRIAQRPIASVLPTPRIADGRQLRLF